MGTLHWSRSEYQVYVQFNIGRGFSAHIDHLRFSNRQENKEFLHIQQIIDNGEHLEHFALAGQLDMYLNLCLLC